MTIREYNTRILKCIYFNTVVVECQKKTFLSQQNTEMQNIFQLGIIEIGDFIHEMFFTQDTFLMEEVRVKSRSRIRYNNKDKKNGENHFKKRLFSREMEKKC